MGVRDVRRDLRRMRGSGGFTAHMVSGCRLGICPDSPSELRLVHLGKLLTSFR
jgi:hypothetical protein